MWDYFWITLIAGCFLAAIVMAILDNMRRKKLAEERAVAVDEDGEMVEAFDEDQFGDDAAMHDLDGLEAPAEEPDFDFTQR